MGDKMPDRKNDKFSEMRAGESHLSEEWHDMEPSSGHTSEKWVGMEPSKGRMSEKWDHFSNETNGMGGGKWDNMVNEKRTDPYAMHHSNGDRTVGMKSMKKQTPDNKDGRAIQHTEFGSTREI